MVSIQLCSLINNWWLCSNDDTIFGNVSLGNADELWSSTRDATDSPIKAFPVSSDSPSFTSGAVTNASEYLEIKTDYIQKDNQSITPGYGKMDYSAGYGLQNPHAALDHVEYAGGKSKTMEKEQVWVNLNLISHSHIHVFHLIKKVIS